MFQLINCDLFQITVRVRNTIIYLSVSPLRYSQDCATNRSLTKEPFWLFYVHNKIDNI